MVDADLIYPVIIKKTKTKLKAMPHDFSSYAALTRP